MRSSPAASLPAGKFSSSFLSWKSLVCPAYSALSIDGEIASLRLIPWGQMSIPGPISYVWIRVNGFPWKRVWVGEILKFGLPYGGLGDGKGGSQDANDRICCFYCQGEGKKLEIKCARVSSWRLDSSLEEPWKGIKTHMKGAILPVKQLWRLDIQCTVRDLPPYTQTLIENFRLSNTIEHLLCSTLPIIINISIIIKINIYWMLPCAR